MGRRARKPLPSGKQRGKAANRSSNDRNVKKVCRTVCRSVPADGAQCGWSVPVPEHKTRGPHGTPRLWRPVLYQLSYGPKCARVSRTPDASVPVPQRLLSNARARAPGAEVTLLLAQGLANGEIAKRLGVSSHTVSTTRSGCSRSSRSTRAGARTETHDRPPPTNRTWPTLRSVDRVSPRCCCAGDCAGGDCE